jgi:glycosyltransferase involved in cell wall biosynthesis
MAIAERERIRVLELCAVDFTVKHFLAPLIRHLGDRGFDVTCGCSRGRYFEELEASGIRMTEVPISRSANPLKNLRGALALAGWILRNRPHLLHVHTPVAALVARPVAWLLRVPVIVYTAHGFYFHENMPRHRWRLHVALEWIAARFQDHLFCVSMEDADAAVALGLARRGDVTYIGNGVNPETFDPARPELRAARERLRAEWGFPADVIVLVATGRLVREKGFIEYLGAARILAPKYPNLRFLVVGDVADGDHDSAKDEIARLAQTPELRDRVVMTGMRADVPEVLAAADIFLLPSYREGMPVSLLEAMMMGLPCIATRIRGCREAVVDGVTGFLVDVGSAEDIAGAVDYLIRNPASASGMGEAGRRRALARFEENAALRLQARVLRSLVEH